MRHDWIFNVLTDLKGYAELNGLPATAAKAAEALVVAQAEIEMEERRLPQTCTTATPPRQN